MKFLVKGQQVRSYLIFCYKKSDASQSKWLISTNTPMIQHLSRNHLFFLKPLENTTFKKGLMRQVMIETYMPAKACLQTIKADFSILHNYCPKKKTKMWASSFSWELYLVAFKKLWITLLLDSVVSLAVIFASLSFYISFI